MSTSTTLSQSVPNPTSTSAQIAYVIGTAFTQAHILLSDMSGKQIQDFPIHTTGEGSINVITSQMSGGTYKYSLIIDSKVYDTKTMVVVSK